MVASLSQASFVTTYTGGMLSGISSSKAGQFGYGYDGLGRRSTVSYPNGIVGTYSYHSDQSGWLSGINYGATYAVSYPSFDKVGNRTAKYDGIGTNYSYDAVYRLLSSTSGETFTYDNAGNRLTDAARLYTITAGNVLAAAGSTSYTYDDLGNTVTAGSWAYSWNGAGKLSTAVSGTTNASYTYDPFGRRISKTVNGVTTGYVYDGQDIAASTTSGVVTHFVHGSGTDDHLAMVQGGVPFFYHVDGLGSVTRLTNGSQTVVGSASYTSFGTPSMSGLLSSQPYGFTGREYDPETGNHHYRARTYNSDTGRFLSRDPLGYAAGDVVLWNYVGGNPVNWVDPDGQERERYLYQKVDKDGNHLKYGTTYDLLKRYSKKALALGRLKPLAKGPAKEMNELERNMHKTLPLGPEEKQVCYKNIQQRNGLKVKANIIGLVLDAFNMVDVEKRAQENGIHWTEQYIMDKYEQAGYTVIYPNNRNKLIY